MAEVRMDASGGQLSGARPSEEEERRSAASGPGSTFGQGARWQGDDPEMLACVVDAAFDYRGDVTLYLRSGEELSGYLSNRNREVDEPFVEVFPNDGGPVRRLRYRELRGLEFSGRDAAAGKSWETWLKKVQARREAEARG
jgi:hypothetical protein